MQAGGDASTRQRASQKLADEFRQTEYVARVILAGAQSRLLGATVRSADQLQAILDQWTCAAPTAGLESAIALAGEVGGGSSRILVVSDHPPGGELPAGKLEWWSFGRPLGNIAFTAASRDTSVGGATGQEDRVLLEVTNFGAAPARTELVLEGADLDAPGRKPLELDRRRGEPDDLESRRGFGRVTGDVGPRRAGDRQRGGPGVAAPPTAARATLGGRHRQIGDEFADAPGPRLRSVRPGGACRQSRRSRRHRSRSARAAGCLAIADSPRTRRR